METIIFDLNYLDESSQEQLDAYRKLGSVRHLKRLRQQEIRRKWLFRCALCALKIFVLGACLAFDIWLIASCIDIIADNWHHSPVHHAWNFFVLCF